jgi:hypothetical protein
MKLETHLSNSHLSWILYYTRTSLQNDKKCNKRALSIIREQAGFLMYSLFKCIDVGGEKKRYKKNT